MQRKHRKEMTAVEIEFAETLVHSVNEWDFSRDHVMERMTEKHINKNDIVNTLKYGDVIEINSLGRVVLRLMKGMKKGTCAVVDMRTRHLVTTWYNDPRDQHKTLVMSEYGWRIDAVKYLGELNAK